MPELLSFLAGDAFAAAFGGGVGAPLFLAGLTEAGGGGAEPHFLAEVTGAGVLAGVGVRTAFFAGNAFGAALALTGVLAFLRGAALL